MSCRSYEFTFGPLFHRFLRHSQLCQDKVYAFVIDHLKQHNGTTALLMMGIMYGMYVLVLPVRRRPVKKRTRNPSAHIEDGKRKSSCVRREKHTRPGERETGGLEVAVVFTINQRSGHGTTAECLPPLQYYSDKRQDGARIQNPS